MPICTRTLSPNPISATTPAPLGPRTPVAWASSTITMAPWRSASSTISPSGAMSPSMLKMDSVAMSLRALAGASFSRLSRCSMSQWRYTDTAARESRQPSMMLAWLSASLSTTSSRSISVAMIPTLAW